MIVTNRIGFVQAILQQVSMDEPEWMRLQHPKQKGIIVTIGEFILKFVFFLKYPRIQKYIGSGNYEIGLQQRIKKIAILLKLLNSTRIPAQPVIMECIAGSGFQRIAQNINRLNEA